MLTLYEVYGRSLVYEKSRDCVVIVVELPDGRTLRVRRYPKMAPFKSSGADQVTLRVVGSIARRAKFWGDPGTRNKKYIITIQRHFVN